MHLRHINELQELDEKRKMERLCQPVDENMKLLVHRGGDRRCIHLENNASIFHSEAERSLRFHCHSFCWHPLETIPISYFKNLIILKVRGCKMSLVCCVFFFLTAISSLSVDFELSSN